MNRSMRIANFSHGAAMLGLVLVASLASAEAPFRVLWNGTGGWGEKSAYCGLYNPNSVQELKGVIVTVEDVTPLPGMRPGVQLKLKTDKETIPIHLGPRWYLENQDITLDPGSEVEVKGSRIVCDGRQVIAASEIVAAGQVIHLRDAKGKPLWLATSGVAHP
jgi:hypothetical protein